VPAVLLAVLGLHVVLAQAAFEDRRPLIQIAEMMARRADPEA
jgi:hypothetical protein